MHLPLIQVERDRYRTDTTNDELSGEQMNLTFPKHKKRLKKRIESTSKKLGIPKTKLLHIAAEQLLDRNDELNQLQQAIIGATL